MRARRVRTSVHMRTLDGIPSCPKVFRFRERVADIPITRLLSLGCVLDPNYRPYDRAVACDIPGIDVH